MVYMDDPPVDCRAVGKAGGPLPPECNCSVSFMRHPPHQCFAADPVNARSRVNRQLAVPEYRAFWDFMCPPARLPRGAVFPPDGSDPGQCPRPVFGTYDDHDSGWNDGDRRNPAKFEIKNIYLDGLGEPPSSPRRGGATGLQAYYSLPSGPAAAFSPAPRSSATRSSPDRVPDRPPDQDRDRVDLILLDERYERETLPCGNRAEFCRRVFAAPVQYGPGTFERALCEEWFVSGGAGGGGSCCRKDDEWTAWCSRDGARKHPRWRMLCDPTSDEFATAPFVLGPDNLTVIAGDMEAAWDSQQGAMWRRLVEGATSPACEMLGAPQRAWLAGLLSSSAAPLRLVASGSVVAGALGSSDNANGTSSCDGDDWQCWPRARANFLHALANASGCAVVMTGDYHFSDIKVINPGATMYSGMLQSEALAKPVWQIMSSGLTRSTARMEGTACEGTWLEDTVGLRPLGPCAYVPQPAFGMVEVDWPSRRVLLSIRDASSGDVAVGRDGSRQQVALSLDTCRQVAP
ncbi:MAG: hypothetical protein J3K34DRAFT_435005 [Monoraphidium minutum]|nr:MAG: hypothetical protein J3K34DRAFT_435005 [Monoraphidium minutum]